MAKTGISEKISEYCEKKEEEKTLSKAIKMLGAEIKEFLLGSGKPSEVVGDWQVQIQHKVTESIDEEKLLRVLKRHWAEKHGDSSCPFVAQVEVVDMEELESAIYKGEIPEDVLMQIDGCRIKKETDALVYSKKKKEEE